MLNGFNKQDKTQDNVGSVNEAAVKLTLWTRHPLPSVRNQISWVK